MPRASLLDLDGKRTNQAKSAVAVGEDPDGIGPLLDLLVQPLENVLRDPVADLGVLALPLASQAARAVCALVGGLVAAELEPAASVLGGDGGEGGAERVVERLV